MSKKIWILLWGLNLVIAFAIISFLFLKENRSELHLSDLDQHQNQDRSFRNSTRSSEFKNLSPFANQILTTPWQSLGDLASEISATTDLSNPDDQESLRKLALELASEIPSHAIDFLGYFENHPFVVKLEQEIMDAWSIEDHTSLLNHVQTRGDFMAHRHLSAMVRSFSDKNHEQYPEFLSWFKTLSQSADSTDEKQKMDFLQGSVSATFANSLKPEQYPDAIDTITGLIGNSAVESQLSILIPRYGEKDPEAAVTWLTENRDHISQELYLNVLDSTLEYWGSGANPHLASDLLSREDFFETFYRPGESGESNEKEMENFFDQRLRSLLRTSIGYHPEDAAFNAELFHNPTLRKEYLEKAFEFIPEAQVELENTP